MGRPRKNKIKIVDEPIVDAPANIETPEPEIETPEPKAETPEPEIEYGLPKKDLFRLDEVASYFAVSDSTIRRWLDHGHLDAEKYMHQIRITRLSIIRLRKSSMLSRRFV